MMRFLFLEDEFGIRKEELPYNKRNDAIYHHIIRFYEYKRDIKNGIHVDKHIFKQSKEMRDTYVNMFIEKYKMIQADVKDKLKKSLYQLIMTLCDYVAYMDSNEVNDFHEHFLKYDVYIMIHLFHYIENIYMNDPTVYHLLAN